MANNDDVIRATAVMLGPSGEVQNVWYFRLAAITAQPDLLVMEDLAKFLDDAYTGIVAAFSSDYAFTEVRGFNMTASVPMPTVPWPSLTAGTGSGTSFPAATSGLITFRTGVSRVFGRKYLGGLHTGNADNDGFWTSGLVTALTAFAGEFLGSFIGDSLVNSYLPGIIKSGGTFLSFLSAVVGNNPAYQRRRRKGRGV